MSTKENRKIYCNKCGHDTWHTQVFKNNITTDEDQEHGISWGFSDRLYICCGCESSTLSHIDLCSECDDNAEYFYPPRFTRKVPEWIENHKIDTEAYWLFKEVYTALYNGLKRLATMGIRSLFDIYIQKKVGDQGTFEKGLSELLTKGHITCEQKEVIQVAIDAGHASVHRSYNPDEETLTTVLDIVEHLYHLEVLKTKSQDVKEKTPPHVKKQKVTS